MMPTTGRPPSGPTAAREVLERESAAVRAELARVDAKSGLLLSWAGGAFAIVAALGVTGAGRLPGPAAVGLWSSAALLAAAAAVLLTAVRPRIPRDGGMGFVVHATAGNDAELLYRLDLSETGRLQEAAHEVWLLSRLTVAKYRTIRVAVDLLLLALVVLAVALPLARG
ncbi:Pycsar system effector family protein [Streptosporangium sandarakinum]